VGHETNRLISRYDPATKKFDEVIGLPGGSHMLIVTPDEQRIFTASSNGSIIAIIDRLTNERGQKNLAFTTFPGDTRMEGMAVSPDGNEFWALHMNSKKISIINVPEKKLVSTISFEGGLNNRIKFTKDGKYVLMNELQGNELRVWDVATRKEVKRIDVGAGGEGIFIDPVRPRAYYTVSAGNKLVVIDTDTMTVIKEIHDLQNPDGMDWFSAK
jgi:DNA-binding beta-propeller fold protein YncE